MDRVKYVSQAMCEIQTFVFTAGMIRENKIQN